MNDIDVIICLSGSSVQSIAHHSLKLPLLLIIIHDIRPDVLMTETCF